jgi:hypothetical protein
MAAMPRKDWSDIIGDTICNGDRTHTQDPIELHRTKGEQLAPTGPAELPILQFPRTASSGRRLIASTFGGSYGLFDPGSRFSSLIRFSPCSMAHSTTPTTGSLCLTQNLEGGCWWHPIVDVDFGGSNAVRGEADSLLLRATMTKFAIAMLGNVQIQG